ncbi:Crp/Fnr family transcriptional regulator [Ochrovirga pacifica]|uniref:Crp/Fnr family transcriptional regulator n=1 Tax=Ochrovirga pacifica TaxID=1042376 RepID=UPI00025597FE|nr:cyclic nucleotide-binding domain-containing protein [Ochrovirga pacifica]
MKEQLLAQVYQHPQLSASDLNKIIAAHQKLYFTKGDFILKEGQVANNYIIIQQGLMRSFVYDYNGDDTTTNFFCEHEIVIEVASLFQRTPSKEYIQALTDGVGYLIDFATFQDLFHSIDNFREWGRGWLSNSLFEFKQRSVSFIKDSATDRYLTLLKQKPKIIQQAPLKHIASFLGVTDTSLSRIRKSIHS